MKKKTLAKVISQQCLQPGIYDLWVETDLAREAGPGQFVGIYTRDASKLLPRPISICQVRTSDNEGIDGLKVDALRMVYRVSSETAGTADIAKLVEGDSVYILGILGNGYDYKQFTGKNVVLMGGGIGIPPMLELARNIKKQMDESGAGTMNIVLGYRDSQMFLKSDFEALENDNIKLLIATEDGSVGTKGNVINACNDNNINAEVVCACGPMPMLRAIVGWAKDKDAKAYISLEERMACGVGACLGCITKTKDVDSHSHVNNTRICTDGPVFDAEILDI